MKLSVSFCLGALLLAACDSGITGPIREPEPRLALLQLEGRVTAADTGMVADSSLQADSRMPVEGARVVLSIKNYSDPRRTCSDYPSRLWGLPITVEVCFVRDTVQTDSSGGFSFAWTDDCERFDSLGRITVSRVGFQNEIFSIDRSYRGGPATLECTVGVQNVGSIALEICRAWTRDAPCTPSPVARQTTTYGEF